MLKFIMLCAVVSSACALDAADTSSVESLTNVPKDCDPEPEGPTCTIRGVVIELDELEANVDDSDGKVSFCHATGSETNPYILLTTDVSGCEEGHFDHEPGGNLDIFGTDGCDD